MVRRKENDESVEDWEGTVELAETVTVPPLSVRTARCRVVRRDDKTNVKVPRYQEVLVEREGLPGVYMARIVATLEHCGNMSSSDVGGSSPLVVNVKKSPLVVSIVSPYEKCVASSDGSERVAGCDGNLIVTHGGNGFPKAGSGECLPEVPEGCLPVAATSHRDDLQAGRGSLPVANQIGNQVDTPYNRKIQKKIGQSKLSNCDLARKRDTRTQVLGYVPIQINNLSLEEMKLERQMYIGVASPISVEEPQISEGYSINSVARDNVLSGEFDKFIQDKLKHLGKKDYSVLEPVLRKYKHLFYGLGSTELGSTSQVEHSIETGDARPIKKNPYRTPTL